MNWYLEYCRNWAYVSILRVILYGSIEKEWWD